MENFEGKGEENEAKILDIKREQAIKELEDILNGLPEGEIDEFLKKMKNYREINPAD